MLPDKFPRRNVAETTDVEIISWDGACEVHEQFTRRDVRELRSVYPDVVVLAHPECPPEVVAAADFSGSTGADVGLRRRAPPASGAAADRVLDGRQHRWRAPGGRVPAPLRSVPHMKRITLAKIGRSLEENLYEVTVDPAVAGPARRASSG